MPSVQSAKPSSPAVKPKDGPVQKKALSDISLLEKVRYILSTAPLFGRFSSYKPEGWNPAGIETRNAQALEAKGVWKTNVLTLCQAATLLVTAAIIAPLIVYGGAIGVSLGLAVLLLVYLAYRLMFLSSEKPAFDNSWVNAGTDDMIAQVKKSDPVGGPFGVQRLYDKAEHEKTKGKTTTTSEANKPSNKSSNKQAKQNKPSAQPNAPQPTSQTPPAPISSSVTATINQTSHLIGTNALNQLAPPRPGTDKTPTKFTVTDASTFKVAEDLASGSLPAAILNLTGGGNPSQMTWHEQELYQGSNLQKILSGAISQGLDPKAPVIYTQHIKLTQEDAAPAAITASCNAPNPQESLKMALRAALCRGHLDLIVPTVGFGANKDNPETTSQLYQKVLNDNEFKDKFFNVIFVTPPHNREAMRNAFATRFPQT